MPLLDDPVGMFANPLGHFDLAVHHALAGIDALTFEIQSDVFATVRLVNQADCDDEFDHGASRFEAVIARGSDCGMPWTVPLVVFYTFLD
jgi:hypothetical protein